MLMRYAWGFGVGHTYSHQDAPNIDLARSSAVQNSSLDQDGEPQALDLTEEALPPSGTSDHHQLEGENGDLEDSAEVGVDDTLENLEEEELAVADPEEEGSEFEEREVQEPDTETED